MFQGFLNTSIMKRAHDRGLIQTKLVNFREFGVGKHRIVDDAPYGGGDGMVLKPEPIFQATKSLIDQADSTPEVILLTPQGERFTGQKAKELSKQKHFILLCGHYAGFDERIREHLVSQEISIGDYVLTGGELPAMILIDSISRHVPGVLGNETSATTDSFMDGLLEYPQYTRPEEYLGYRVPEVLLSGHHQQIREWRRRESLRRTWKRRPDLLESASLTEEDRRFLLDLEEEQKE